MRSYELNPVDGRKSFYGKAVVVVDDNGVETLVSYGTAIMKRNSDGSYERLSDFWSLTTGRHIKAFCGMNKSEYLSTVRAGS